MILRKKNFDERMRENTMDLIENKNYDEERALYNIKDTEVKNCVFAGEQDGESVLKETRNIVVDNCSFSLRYPMWHVRKYELINSKLDEKTRAPIWYSRDGIIKNTVIMGVKALRECKNTVIDNCKIQSTEFGWKSKNTDIKDSELESEYVFFNAKDVKLDNVKFNGKYSFQYVDNLEIVNSVLNTKDAFWHSKNVTVKNSVINGEYLCYCKNLKLINCEMKNCDLAFEYSEVNADIVGNIISIKNPKSGKIKVDSVDEIINGDSVMPVKGKVIIK